jgi:hypothetical protein
MSGLGLEKRVSVHDTLIRRRNITRATWGALGVAMGVTVFAIGTGTGLFNDGGTGPRDLGLEDTEDCVRGTLREQGFSLAGLNGDFIGSYVVACALQTGLDTASPQVEGLIDKLYIEANPGSLPNQD